MLVVQTLDSNTVINLQNEFLLHAQLSAADVSEVQNTDDGQIKTSVEKLRD